MDSRVALGRIQAFIPGARSKGESGRLPAAGADFRSLLTQNLQGASSGELNVSSHAEKRLMERHIPMDGKTKGLLMEALQELQAKGARDSLVITQDAAFLLNVPTRTLVTAMDLREAQERIITQIDSVSLKNS